MNLVIAVDIAKTVLGIAVCCPGRVERRQRSAHTPCRLKGFLQLMQADMTPKQLEQTQRRVRGSKAEG